MAFSAHTFRTAFCSTATDILNLEVQQLRQPSSYGMTSNVCVCSPLDYQFKSSWSRNLNSNRRVMCPPQKVIEHGRSSPCIQDPCSSWRNQELRAMNDSLCQSTFLHTIVNCKQDSIKKKRRSSIESPSLVRCEREWKGKRDAHPDVTGKHEHGDCGKEWKGRKDMRREYTPRYDEHEDAECHEGHDSSSPEVEDKGYIIKVSKELMGLFCYIEKRKRTMIRELAYTLRQVAAVAFSLTCVRGILAPLVEVFKTKPPSWSKLLLMLVSFDSIAICYLAIKSSEPLEQLGALTTENRADIMECVEKEEEMILRIATEFIRLFRRIRNIAISITVSQTAQLFYEVWKLKDPNFVANCLKVVQTWLLAPWS